jgi:hypothetical protein
MSAAATEPGREGPIRYVYGGNGIAVVCSDCGKEKWAEGRNSAEKIARAHVCKKARR